MSLLVALFLAPFIFVTTAFGVELIVGVRPLRPHRVGLPPATAIIIVPAHNEETIIADNLRQLKTAAGTAATILVVADNCDDATADLARSAEVDVLVRNDPARRGKGFALAFARDALSSAPPDVVLVIDADCRSDAQSIAALLRTCVATGRPCQATNLQTANPKASPTVQLASFAFYIKNVVRQRALQRLAGRGHLLGTGMAFPWAVFECAALATDNIAEDMRLGIELAEAGRPALFVEQATVWSDPETEANMLVQRQRWEGGFLQNAVRAAPRIFISNLAHRRVRGLWAAINMLVPPLALLILLDCAALAIGGLLGLAGASLWPMTILAGSLALACAALACAWAMGGSRFITAGSLARIPGYVIWKLPMYFGFARRGTPRDWIRTR